MLLPECEEPTELCVIFLPPPCDGVAGCSDGLDVHTVTVPYFVAFT